MDGYISNFAAARMWNIPFVETVIGNEISEFDAADITVAKYNAKSRINGRKVHFLLPVSLTALTVWIFI